MGYSSKLSQSYSIFIERYGTRENLYKFAFGNLLPTVTKYVELQLRLEGLDLTKKDQPRNVEVSLSELDYCAYVKLSGNSILYRGDHYSQIDLVYDYINSVVNGLGDVVKDMVDNQIPLPESFVKRYKNTYLPSYLEVNYTRVMYNYSRKYGVDPIVFEESKVVSMQYFINLLKTKGSEEGDKVFVTAVKLNSLYDKLTNNGKISVGVFDNVVSKLYRDTYYTKTADGTERISTKTEKKRMFCGVYKKRKSLLGPEKEQSILTIAWLFTGKKKYYHMAKLSPHDTVELDIWVNLDKISASIDYMSTPEYLTIDCAELLNHLETVYPDKADDELQDITLIEMLKYIKKECDPEDTNTFLLMARDIACKAIRNKDYGLSEKQINVVNKVYEIFKDKKAGKINKSVNKYTSGIDSKMRALSKELGNNSFDNMLRNIIDRGKKNKFLSEKQYNLLIDAYESRCISGQTRSREPLDGTKILLDNAEAYKREHSNTESIIEEVDYSLEVPEFDINDIFRRD